MTDGRLIQRPPLGFVVEGYGEFNCYPSLVCRIVNSSGFKVPCVNAGGFGGIWATLGEQLSALVLAHHPVHIVVTVDLIDLVKEQLVQDCPALLAKMRNDVAQWLAGPAQLDGRLLPLPDRISCVIQVQKFESWFAADVAGLDAEGHLRAPAREQLEDVDNSVLDPASWLRDALLPGISLKNPKQARKLVSAIRPGEMRRHSRSFDRFAREVELGFNDWRSRCGI